MKSKTDLPHINPKQEADKITAFIQKTFKKAQKSQAIVAMSGGIDSSVAASLTAKALGPQNVHALILPSLTSSVKNTDDATALAEILDIPRNQIHEINLSGMQTAVRQTLILYTGNSDHMPDIRIGNIAARLRMITIFDQAKAKNALVVGTENKSEHLLAYFTRFGDEASDLEPIKHLYKTQLIDLAQYLVIPKKIITKPPSADLWENQTDETELGFTYTQADPILHLHFDKQKSAQQIINLGFASDLVNQVINHCNKVNYKHTTPYHL